MFVKENPDKKKEKKKKTIMSGVHKMVKHIKNHARFLMCFTILWTPGILVISHIASTVFELAYALLH